MKERPILLNSAMVRAVLDGTKTQTRRVLKAPESVTAFKHFNGIRWDRMQGERRGDTINCPYGQPGDRIYVRETWQHSNFPNGPLDKDCLIFYQADYLDDPLGADLEHSGDGIRRMWKPSIHMPRWVSRITLEITGVRVERLNDISEADAVAEGVYRYPDGNYTNYLSNTGYALNAKSSFASLWESINGADLLGATPWVWVIEFKVIELKGGM